MKIKLSVYIIIVFGYLFLPQLTQAVDICYCDIIISGSCEMERNLDIEFGANSTLAQSLTGEEDASCFVFDILRNLHGSQQFIVNNTICEGITARGSVGGSNYEMVCSADAEAVGVAELGNNGNTGDNPDVGEVKSALGGLNKFSSGTNIPKIIGRAVGILVYFVGAAGFLMFIYAGFIWMTSQGSAEKTKKALLIMMWTSIGLVALLSAYVILKLVFEAFG